MRTIARLAFCLLALTMNARAVAGTANVAIVAAGTPPGFSELATSRVALVDIYFGDRKVGEALADIQPGLLEIPVPSGRPGDGAGDHCNAGDQFATGWRSSDQQLRPLFADQDQRLRRSRPRARRHHLRRRPIPSGHLRQSPLSADIAGGQEPVPPHPGRATLAHQRDWRRSLGIGRRPNRLQHSEPERRRLSQRTDSDQQLLRIGSRMDRRRSCRRNRPQQSALFRRSVLGAR